MGALKDLGTGTVAGIDEITGYPKDEQGHLLNPISHRDGAVVDGWQNTGTKLVNFTNPYGQLLYAVGSGDDFHCFDFATINAGPRGRFIILEATINSETASFIEGGGYEVLPINTDDEKRTALCAAERMVNSAIEWCNVGDEPMKHTRTGWNQEPRYFVRSIARQLFEFEFQKYNGKEWVDVCSEREFRFGSKRIDGILDKIYGGVEV